VLGIREKTRIASDFYNMFSKIGFKDSLLTALVIVASVIALSAGICILLEMLKVKITFFDNFILIVAVVWAIYIIIELVAWITEKTQGDTFQVLQVLAVHLMVFGSLLIASKKFD
jgi:hypothetical protein